MAIFIGISGSYQFDTSLLVKSLSVGLQGKAAVAEVRGSNNQLAKEFGLGAQPQYPIILALCSENGKLAGLKYPGNMKKRAEIEAWVDTNFLGRNRMKTCKNLRNAEADEAKRRHKLTLSVASMNKEQLLKKRVKQLREIAEDLDIKTAQIDLAHFSYSAKFAYCRRSNCFSIHPHMFSIGFN